MRDEIHAPPLTFFVMLIPNGSREMMILKEKRERRKRVTTKGFWSSRQAAYL
jgi:hypothetical protein